MYVRKLKAVMSALLALAVAFTIFPARPAGAQKIILSVAVPEYMTDTFKPEIFEKFTAENPNVTVNIVLSGQDGYFSPAAFDVQQFAEAAEKYVSSADVLWVNDYNFSNDLTRAGYILDLAPLIASDASLPADDFIANSLDAFRWDNGVWALPISLDLQLFSYDVAAFEKAGVAPPDASWTWETFADAVRRLTQRDADNQVIVPGFGGFEVKVLFRAFLGEGFYDSGSIPNPPRLDNPALSKLLDGWQQLQDEGAIMYNFRGDFSLIPFNVDRTFAAALRPTEDGSMTARGAALLPGGVAGLAADGFALSSGTQYPDQAYALLKYLISEPTIAARVFSFSPARKSVAAALEALGDSVPRYRPKFTPETQAVIDEALKNPLLSGEVRYHPFISKAQSLMREKQIDGLTALQETQAAAMKVMADLDARRGSTQIVVATPPPQRELQAGEIALKFLISPLFMPIPNREKWEQAIAEFTSTDPQVKQITFETGWSSSIKETTSKYDCFYLPYQLTSANDLQYLLNLDPLMAADSDFDKSDFINGALEQMQVEGKIWAMPTEIRPQAMQYSPKKFQEAGVPLPENTWTIAEFNDAVRRLKPSPTDEPPFVPNDYTGGSHLLLLMAAYGALPLDLSTTPPTINYTDPAAVDAIRQVLDLAKNGYMKYQKLVVVGMSGGFGSSSEVPITTRTLSLNDYSIPPDQQPYRLISYPKGTHFTPVSYDVGGAYISASTPAPEGCYRFISFISGRTDLLWGLPARRSLADDPAFAAQGEDVVAFFKFFDTLTRNPETRLISAQVASFDHYIPRLWLFRVFDRYVLDNAELEPQLNEAEMFTKAYLDCTASLPKSPEGTTQAELTAFYKQFTDCAVKIDPTIKPIVSPQQ